MNNVKNLAVLVTLLGVSMVSAYYNQYDQQDAVTSTLDTVTGGRYSDTPQDAQKRKESNWKRQDRERSAQRKYEKDQANIQKQKEDRRGIKRQYQ